MISSIFTCLQKGNTPVEVIGLKGSSGAYLIHQIQKQMNTTVVLVSPEPEKAEILYRDLCFFYENRQGGGPGCSPEILFYPPWETLPFDGSSPYAQLQGRRIHALWRLQHSEGPVAVVLPLQALVQRVVSRAFLKGAVFHRATRQSLEREDLAARLLQYGYTRVGLVEEKGDFSVRGGIIDFYPSTMEEPIRVELLGDMIDSIRLFHPQSQRSVRPIGHFDLLPLKEIPWSEETRRKAKAKVLKRAQRLGWPSQKIHFLLDALDQGVEYPGVEYLLPFFHDRLETFFDYLPDRSIVFIDSFQDTADRIENLWEEIVEREEATIGGERFCPRAEDLYIQPREILSGLERFRRIFLNEIELFDPNQKRSFPVRVRVESNEDLRDPLKRSVHAEQVVRSLSERIQDWIDHRIGLHFACKTLGHAERLKELFGGYGLKLEMAQDMPGDPWGIANQGGKGTIHIGELSSGFRFLEMNLIVIVEEEIFGPGIRRRAPYRYKGMPSITSFEDIRENDFIVHVDHGIGLFKGLSQLEIHSIQTDFLLIEYLGKDKLYVPIDRLNVIQRYVGSEGFIPPLDRLGTKGWDKKKGRARESIKKMANELIKIYAARTVLKGHPFSRGDRYLEEFEKAFEYEETPDQMATIQDVMEDMEQEKPMDRLICGDVGYGKTEVAMRAAFKAVMDGKQVALLVPTTILAEQHNQTFSDRFKGYPVFIEVLSRFKTRKEQRTIVDGCRKGKIDILIGTHRLLQKDVVFKDLGLLVIDEEQRFGVWHKERLKKMKELVDVITLTATPIPRTLHMSLIGLRDLSIIHTPPPDRLAIRTHICKFDPAIIEEAIRRELQRGGQIFFVHNRIRGIGSIAKYLQKLVPSARFAVAHGQLKGSELEKVMIDFIQRRIDVLVCTTIIQSGLDIPSANTIIINHADRLGLAEMHQIRGRVGRSGHRAYAYFLIPRGVEGLSAVSRKRLRALQEFSELGAGFQIATRDLEIRGAGTLLGVSQSGHIDTIGFEMYTQLLEATVAELKGQPVQKEIEPEIRLPVPAYLPDTYVPETNQRLTVYKRAASLKTAEELRDFRVELIDRYGHMPPEGNNLLEILKIKNTIRELGISSLQLAGNDLILDFDPGTRVKPEGLVQMVVEKEDILRLTHENRLVMKVRAQRPEGIFQEIEGLLKELAFHGGLDLSTIPVKGSSPIGDGSRLVAREKREES